MIRREDDGLWLEMEESIAVHHEDVFECLTTASGLSRWFPYAAEIDLQQGGQLALHWDAKKSKTTTVAILDYDPGGRITWDWFAGLHDRHAPVYFEVEPDVEEGAVIHFRQGPYPEENEALMGMVDEALYWRWRLCNLRSVLESKHDMRKVRPL